MRHVLISAFIALAACTDGLAPTDNRSPTQGDAPGVRKQVVDGENGGARYFNFLPPLVSAPQLETDLDMEVPVTVAICSWTGTHCSEEIVRFEREPAASGSEAVRVGTDGQHYIVNWHTADFALTNGQVYRVMVSVGGRELGHADVVVFQTAGHAKNVQTGDYVPLVDGRTLPIKFHIGEGWGWPSFEMAALTTNGLHQCGLDRTGKAYCWGMGSAGALGTGDTRDQSIPNAVATDLRFRVITSGVDWHTCALTLEGLPYCWGQNTNGEFGNGTTVGSSLPQRAAPGPYRDITAGTAHTCALTEEGRVDCWGLGVPTPTPVVGGPYSTVVTGAHHTCALDMEGRAYCWGDNGYAQLGDGTRQSRVAPTAVLGNLRYSSIVAGALHTCGITLDGRAYCWGRGEGGQLGTGQWPIIATAPVAVVGGLSFVQLSAGGDHTCGLTAGGVGYCWGDQRDEGRLGVGIAQAVIPTPTPIAGGHRFASIAAGRIHSCGLLLDTSQVMCWGANYFGAVGDGSFENRQVPVAVASP